MQSATAQKANECPTRSGLDLCCVPSPGVRSRGDVETDPRQAQRNCGLIGVRVACHGTSMLTLTFHVCVKLKRNLHRNKFGNWFLQFLGVQQEPPFTSTSQSTVTPRHPTTVLFKNNSAHPQQGLDRERAIPRRKGMNKKRLTDPFPE